MKPDEAAVGLAPDAEEASAGSEEDASAGETRAPRRRRFAEFAEAYALVILTIALIVLFSFLPASADSFPTTPNLRYVLAGQAVLVALSMALLFVIVLNVWDFTPGAVAGMAAIVAAKVGASSDSALLAILAAVGVGMFIGAINGFFVAVVRANSVIATFGVTILIAGFIQLLTGGQSVVNGIPNLFTNLGNDTLLSQPLIAWLALVIVLVTYFILRHTALGREGFAIGYNMSAARLVGVRVSLMVFLAFVATGAVSALGGLLLLANIGAANPGVGPDLTIPAYAAVFLGATSITPGKWNVSGTCVAIIFLGVLNSGLTLVGASPTVNQLTNGGALLIGVGAAMLLARQRGRSLPIR